MVLATSKKGAFVAKPTSLKTNLTSRVVRTPTHLDRCIASCLAAYYHRSTKRVALTLSRIPNLN